MVLCERRNFLPVVNSFCTVLTQPNCYFFLASLLSDITLFVVQAPINQKEDSLIHRINYYPLDNAIGFPKTYPSDSDLSGGWRYLTFEQLGPGARFSKVPIINGPGKLSPFALKIEVSIVLHPT